MPRPSSLTAWERWEMASFDSPEAAEEAAPEPVSEATADAVPPAPTFTAADLEAQLEAQLAELKAEASRAGFEEGRAAGHKEGYADGHAEGYEKGHAESTAEAEAQGRTHVEQLLALIEKFEEKLGELDEAIAPELMALSLEIARKVIVQDLAVKPESVIAAIHEALTHLPMQHATIHVHPEDASLVRTYAGEQLSHSGHRIHEDRRLKRGDVVIDAGSSHLDATLATRWRRVLDELGQDEPWIDTPPAA